MIEEKELSVSMYMKAFERNFSSINESREFYWYVYPGGNMDNLINEIIDIYKEVEMEKECRLLNEDKHEYINVSKHIK